MNERRDEFKEKSERTVATRNSAVNVTAFHTLQQRSKKRTQVEALFDGLTQFFSIRNNVRKRNRPCSASDELSSEIMLDSLPTDSICLQKAAAAECSASCLNNIDTASMQLKNLHDGLSHLYSVNGERKRKSRFFYAPSPIRLTRRAECVMQKNVKVQFGSEDSACNVLLKKHEVDQLINEKQSVHFRCLKKSYNKCSNKRTRETWRRIFKDKVVDSCALPHVDKGRFHSLY